MVDSIFMEHTFLWTCSMNSPTYKLLADMIKDIDMDMNNLLGSSIYRLEGITLHLLPCYQFVESDTFSTWTQPLFIACVCSETLGRFSSFGF